MTPNNICMICKKKNASTAVHKLKIVEQTINSVFFTNLVSQDKINTTYKNVINDKSLAQYRRGLETALMPKYHCDFGISCSTLSRINNDIKRVAESLLPKLYTLLMYGDNKTVNLCIDKLRGEYGNAYSAAQRLRAILLQKKKQGY